MKSGNRLFANLRRLDSPADAASIVRTFGQAIGADRCFLYLRFPPTRSGLVAACWLRDRDAADLPAHDYLPFDPEPDFLHESDPMFVAAMGGHPATFVEDVRSADGLVNAEFEAEFNHRSLVHINLHAGPLLVGILQPAMNVTPRIWSDADQALVAQAREDLSPLVANAMAARPWAFVPVRQWGTEDPQPVRAK
jgi:hypothetical protein